MIHKSQGTSPIFSCFQTGQATLPRSRISHEFSKLQHRKGASQNGERGMVSRFHVNLQETPGGSSFFFVLFLFFSREFLHSSLG